MKYTTLADVKNYILKEVSPSFEPQIEIYIEAISRYMDKHCNRVLVDDTPKAIKYDGDGTSVLHIKDCCEITLVTLDGETVFPLKYPTNKDYASRLVLRDFVWTKGLQNVEVTGIHAMSADLPDDIRLACTILTGAICRFQLAGDKTGTTERIGNYQVSYSTPEQKAELEMAKNILSGYRRIAL